jgi:hypothetical protein
VGQYNGKLQNAVYVSTRGAEKELGSHSNRRSVMRWFRELQHYGFIRMVSPAHHGVNGHGKAPHWRLTEEWYLGKAPTRDYLCWNGSPFRERKSRNRYSPKNTIRGAHACTALAQTRAPLVPQIVLTATKTGAEACAISEHMAGAHACTITSLTTPCSDPELISAYLAAWEGVHGASSIESLCQPPAARPDRGAVNAYLAAWEAFGHTDSVAVRSASSATPSRTQERR